MSLPPRLCFPSRYGVSWFGHAVSPVCESLGAGALVGLGVCVPAVSVPERKGEREVSMHLSNGSPV